jgi:hypothetical protein
MSELAQPDGDAIRIGLRMVWPVHRDAPSLVLTDINAAIDAEIVKALDAERKVIADFAGERGHQATALFTTSRTGQGAPT